MAEFISRLAERALGVAPVVQPLIASIVCSGANRPLAGRRVG
jgi:hypothetical protein